MILKGREERFNIPKSLRGRDAGTWQYDTVTDRLPAIARRVARENALTRAQAAAVEALADDMPHGLIRLLTDTDAPDTLAWATYCRPHLGLSWLDAPWFFVEMYFFRRILEATGYFRPGDGYGLDPYRYQKTEGLRLAGPGLETLAASAGRPADLSVLQQILRLDLWGNQSDLSIWPAAGDGAVVSPDGGHLLVDDSRPAAEIIFRRSPIDIGFVPDNAGLEFTGDLLTIDYLLHQQLAHRVILFVKPHPTFVSDATAPDLTTSLAYLRGHRHEGLRAAGDRLTAAMIAGRLRPHTHWFWTSPLAFWEMPDDLRARLNATGLVILKGDMNYRRLTGDRHWPYDTPLSALPRVLLVPVLALRVCKAEVAVGLDRVRLEAVNAADPEWRVNGRWGMLQLHPP